MRKNFAWTNSSVVSFASGRDPVQEMEERARNLALRAIDEGWTVVDAEWHEPSDQLYIFDILKHNGRLLDSYTYADRYALLPRVYTSPLVETLPILKTVEQCLEVLESQNPIIEGLVFKAPHTEGFLDTSIIRCTDRPAF